VVLSFANGHEEKAYSSAPEFLLTISLAASGFQASCRAIFYNFIAE
jgi:hypothetical protein